MRCILCETEIEEKRTTCSRKCSSALGSIKKLSNYEQTFEQRFWERVNRGDVNSCWEWKACRGKEGYGQLKKRRKMVLAHRLSYILSFGEIADNICVLHRCDNPPCVNPKHLFLGTREDNNKDKKNKGRQPSHVGNHNPNRKINAEQVKQIRELYATGNYLQKELSKLFGVNQPHISRIIRGEAW